MTGKSKKTFLLYCGTPKSGSSWIYQYLRQHPSCEMPAEKELHVLDRIFFPKDFDKWNRFRMNRLVAMKENLKNESIQQNRLLMRKIIAQTYQEFSIVYDLEVYPFFFQRLLSTGEKKAQLTGDLTPSYAYLTRDELGKVKRLMEDAGFEIKILFAMRDPVQRIYSHLRMVERWNNAVFSLGEPGKEFKDAKYSFKDFFKHPFLERCTRYDICIENIEAIFSRDKIHYIFYEEFFCTNEVKRLCKFLEIKFKTPDLDTYVNKTEKNLRLADEDKVDAIKYYKKTYDFVLEKFGHERVKKIWPELPDKQTIEGASK